jgi:hypothetical protein
MATSQRLDQVVCLQDMGAPARSGKGALRDFGGLDESTASARGKTA